MMIFSELYSAYYTTVAKILKAAVDHPLQRDEITRIIEENAFKESILTILPALKEERWQLVRSDGTTPLKHIPTMPLTLLQKRWLAAIAQDPRIRLFTDQSFDFLKAEPLFSFQDLCVMDRYCDGDDYTDESYIRHFRLILAAIKSGGCLKIVVQNREGKAVTRVIQPQYLEYSEKDDKFRVIAMDSRFESTINLGRIKYCERWNKPNVSEPLKVKTACSSHVVFELADRRKSLERVLLHFAHFEKQVEKIKEGLYRITVIYDKNDETEMVIRILSFGPMIRVMAPQYFIDLIKALLTAQISCGYL